MYYYNIELDFEQDFQSFLINRMYPPGYRKESTMIETDAIIVGLRAIADLGGPAILELPRNPVGLPEGSFVLDSFMNYTADCLLGKSLPTSKGTLGKKVDP